MIPAETQTKHLRLNRPQLRFALLQPKRAINNWGRAGGKSSLIAWLMKEAAEKMPRSAWIILGSTYKQILTRTLPSTIGSLERMGYVRDVHFFVGKRAPASWKWSLPYEPPVGSYEHFIHFYTGTGFHMVSQDKGGGSSRGLNIDGIIADESLLIDKDRFDQEVSPTNRGNDRYFSKVPFHHGVFHFTSMPYGEQGKWLLEPAKYYEADGYDFTFLRNELIKVQLKFIDEKDIRKRLEIYKQIRKLKAEIRFYKSKSGFFYQEADVFDNLDNVSIKYIEEQRRTLADFIFMTEMLNKRPEKIEGGFYPYLDTARHTYEAFNNDFLRGLEFDSSKLSNVTSLMDEDCDPSQPLRIAVDWGARINCLAVGQMKPNGLAFLNALYVKHPLILDDLADKFIAYYQPHLKKEVFFAYDHTGNTHMANSNLTYADQFAAKLRAAGWTVHFVAKSAPPRHQEKYLLWSRILKEAEARLPRVRFNRHNCKYLLISMQNAPAKDGPTGIEKHKGSERSHSLPQEEATHFSDTADILLFSVYEQFLQTQTEYIGLL